MVTTIMKPLRPKDSTLSGPCIPSELPIKKASKSRNGCQRCRSRRTKCDEGKPFCRRCTDKGFTCPGYAKDFRWSDKYEVLLKPPTDHSPAHHPLTFELGLREMTMTSVPASDQFISPQTADAANIGRLESPPPYEHWMASQPLMAGEYNPVFDNLPPLDPPMSVVETFEPSVFNNLPLFDEQQWCFLKSPDSSLACLSTAHLRSSQCCEAAAPATNLTVDSEVIDETEDVVVSTSEHHSRALSTSSSQSSANLLRWFYRTEPEQYSDTDLVEHYFDQVCRLYAIFDSTKNPFRTLVGSNWDSSGSISLAVQSMACGHLANKSQAMVRAGLQKQEQARRSIKEDLRLWRTGKISGDKILLAALLLGTTVSWHKESDIGLDYINIARELIQAKLKQPTPDTNPAAQSLEQFFNHAMIYWEMLVALVDNSTRTKSPDSESLAESLQHLTFGDSDAAATQSEKVKPHPWTGISAQIQVLFAEIGRIMRRRVEDGESSSTTASEEAWASAIEKVLKAAVVPKDDTIDDIDDKNTPQVHFVQLAEAYRCAGVLQIYHVFPQVLQDRMISERCLGAPIPSASDMRRYRTDLAINILSLVEGMPLWSGASCLHPILILTAGSELRYYGQPPGDDLATRSANQGVAMARSFAEERLCALAARLPQKPYLRMLDILRKTWLQLDMLNTEVHWMQIMYEHGLETIMG